FLLTAATFAAIAQVSRKCTVEAWILLSIIKVAAAQVDRCDSQTSTADLPAFIADEEFETTQSLFDTSSSLYDSSTSLFSMPCILRQRWRKFDAMTPPKAKSLNNTQAPAQKMDQTQRQPVVPTYQQAAKVVIMKAAERANEQVAQNAKQQISER